MRAWPTSPVGAGLQTLGVYTARPRRELPVAKVRAYALMTAGKAWLDNALGMCMFIPWTNDQKVEIVRAITGWETNMCELLKAGERHVTMMRLFNMRSGWTRADDKLPERMAENHLTGAASPRCRCRPRSWTPP